MASLGYYLVDKNCLWCQAECTVGCWWRLWHTDLLSLSTSHMSQICITWIKFLHQRLLALPIWPRREFVDTNMLGCFRKNYPTTRVVLDCIELFIERPSSCRGQSATFSSYKNQGWIYCVCVCVGGGGCTPLSLAKGGEGGGVLFFMI